MVSRSQPCADTGPSPRSLISMSELLAAASTFTDLRNGIEEVLRDHITIDADGFTIKGYDAAAEALIFYFAGKMNPA